jgi:integrase
LHTYSEGIKQVKRVIPKAAQRAITGGRTVFTELSVRRQSLPAPGEQADFFEPLERGRSLGLRISYGGTKAWRVNYYINGKPRNKTLGRYPAMNVQAARKAARTFDPKAATAAAEAGSFKEVAEKWLHHHARHLRTRAQFERMLNSYVYPQWATRKFFEIRRGDVNALLDRLEDKHGLSQCDCVLSVLRSIMNWFATRDENYVSPIVKGMNRDKRSLAERSRKRILTDDEIRAVWNACDGTFGALVRLLLLTAQRAAKVTTMKWDDVADGVWTIHTEEREKGNAGRIRLPKMALDIIAAQPRIAGNPYVFAGRNGSFNSSSQGKAAMDRKLPADMPGWVLHDLRRTARSLMAGPRLNVSRDVAERVLGHVVGGVEGVYDRHDYFDEKAAALSKLATLIEQIINPPSTTNVVELRR